MMDHGRIVELAEPEVIFDRPAEARTQEFVSKILKH
jgi:ABC-type polar amino acid transport system ATPase subunit